MTDLCVCNRCGYEWYPKVSGRLPIKCPKCQCRNWWEARKDAPVKERRIPYRFKGVSYDNLDAAYRIWQSVGDSTFTAKVAAGVLGIVSPNHLAGKLRQFRNGGVIDDSNGNMRAHYSSWEGESTKWKFTPAFRAWAREKGGV